MSTTVCLTFDFDAYSLWITTFRQTSATPLSRGEYSARVGVPRVLALLQRHGIPATFFVPGHTAEAFPGSVKNIMADGHEVGAHGYLHENTLSMSLEDERAVLIRGEEALARVTGVKPLGYRSPAWDLSPHMIGLLEERAYLYDSSLMLDDFRPHWAPAGYDVGAENQVTRRPDSSVVELPVAWELDDFPYFHFVTRPSNPGLRKPQDVFEIWFSEFDYCHSHVDGGVFVLTMHPEIIGRGPRIEMLSRLVSEMQKRDGVRFATMAQAAASFRKTHVR